MPEPGRLAGQLKDFLHGFLTLAQSDDLNHRIFFDRRSPMHAPCSLRSGAAVLLTLRFQYQPLMLENGLGVGGTRGAVLIRHLDA